MMALASHWFSAEPIRTLDAIHLATAVLARSLVDELVVLSLDERIRHSAEQMGFQVLPKRMGPERRATLGECQTAAR